MSKPLSAEEEAGLRRKWTEFINAINPDYHPTGVVPRLLATLDAERLRAEQAESAVEPLTREIIEDRTMFLWGELDDGKGERWLQHDGAGDAWTPDPDVLQLLNLAARAALEPATSEEGMPELTAHDDYLDGRADRE